MTHSCSIILPSACDFPNEEVSVEFAYSHGCGANRLAHPDEQHPGEPATADVTAVLLDGIDIRGDLGERLLARMAEQCCDDYERAWR